jgi:4-hydroxy-4-methyl-2-oxoglutarate aldolase
MSGKLKPSPSPYAEARELGSALIHEAAGRIGALPSALKPVAPGMNLAGPAYTVTGPPRDNLRLHEAVYAARPGDILVFAPAGFEEAGYWGEILTVAAMERKIGGLVIAAGVRDSARLRELGFPVFCTRVCIRGTDKSPGLAGGRVQRLALGDVIVEAGDMIVGDDDGLCAIPAAEAASAVAAAKKKKDAEDRIMGRLRQGESTLDILGLKPKA